jgi:hypothetical protein
MTRYVGGTHERNVLMWLAKRIRKLARWLVWVQR